MPRWWGLAVAPAPPGATLTGSARWNAFGNSLADSVSFRFPSWPSLGGSPRASGDRRSRQAPPPRHQEIQNVPVFPSA